VRVDEDMVLGLVRIFAVGGAGAFKAVRGVRNLDL